jgi:hypothetical protein
MNRRNFFGMLFGAAAVGAVVSLPAQSTTTAVTMDDRRRALGAIKDIINDLQPKPKYSIDGEWPKFKSRFELHRWVSRQFDVKAGRV